MEWAHACVKSPRTGSELALETDGLVCHVMVRNSQDSEISIFEPELSGLYLDIPVMVGVKHIYFIDNLLL